MFRSQGSFIYTTDANKSLPPSDSFMYSGRL